MGSKIAPSTAAASAAEYAEDTQHSTGDTGLFILAVRNDTASALAGTDGDYIPLIVNASGALHVTGGAVNMSNFYPQGPLIARPCDVNVTSRARSVNDYIISKDPSRQHTGTGQSEVRIVNEESVV